MSSSTSRGTPAHLELLPATESHPAISPELWALFTDQLAIAAFHTRTVPDDITIAVSSRFSTGSANTKSKLVTVVRSTIASSDYVVYLPSSIATELGLTFNQFDHPKLIVSPTLPIPLSSVVLASKSKEAYEYAGKHQSELAKRLVSTGIIAQNQVIEAYHQATEDEDEESVFKWEIAMTEPVLQGIVLPGQTQFIVLPPAIDNQNHDELESDAESIASIDDSFLASTVLKPRHMWPSSPGFSGSSSQSQGLLFADFSQPTSKATRSSTPSRSLQRRKGSPFQPILLQQFIHPSNLVPAPNDEEDDANRVYMKSHDLGRVGVFSGDYVVVHASEESLEVIPEKRVARVFALDKPELYSASSGLPTALLPPSFLYNLLPMQHNSTTATFYLTPLLSSPALPIASSLTVARVSSPQAVNRIYQPLFLDSLREYFQGRKRILRRGDLIGVGINEEALRFVEGREKSGEEDELDIPLGSNQPTCIVYFQIASLDVPAPCSNARLMPRESLERQIQEGLYGCIVDPSLTKLVQTGVERRIVPDMSGYLGLTNTPTISFSPTTFGQPTPASRFLEYITSLLRTGVSEYDLHLTVLMSGAEGIGKRTLVRAISRKTGFHLLELDCFDLIGDTDAKTEGHIRARVDKALACSPCILLLRNIEALARKSQSLETGQDPPMASVLNEMLDLARDGWRTTGYPIVVVATTCDTDKIPTSVLGLFKEDITLQAPDEGERLAILKNRLSGCTLSPDVSLRALAVQTAALVASDLVDLVHRACQSATLRVLNSLASRSSLSSPYSSLSSISNRVLFHVINTSGISLTSIDFNTALDKARSAYSDSIGAPKIPSVTWDDVGGLASVKSDILDTIQLPLEHPELFADGLKKRSGILLYGPPGTGKTLLAKAVATSCSLNFFSVKGPELLNMYIGESEANVRRVFAKARAAKPCVIFFDELDSVAPKRGNQGDSGGVMDRIVSQLLAELDGMSEGGDGSGDVFVIGATNRPDLLDPALLRPGRFDKMLYLGVSETHSAQLNIIQALTRKFKLDPQTRLEDVSEMCPFNYTGADFYALCSDAMLKAMTRKAGDIDHKIAQLNTQPPWNKGKPLTPQYYLAEMASPQDVEVLVGQQDFKAALDELVPSVSQEEMLHYKRVQAQFSKPREEDEDRNPPSEPVLNEDFLQSIPPLTKMKGKGKAIATNDD